MTEQLVPPDYLLDEEELLEDENTRPRMKSIPRTSPGLLLLERPVNELWKLKGTSGNISLTELCELRGRRGRKLRRGKLLDLLDYVNSLLSGAPQTCRYRAAPIISFSVRQRRSGTHSSTFRPTIRYRPESFSSSRTRRSRKVWRAVRFIRAKSPIFRGNNYRRSLPEAAQDLRG